MVRLRIEYRGVRRRFIINNSKMREDLKFKLMLSSIISLAKKADIKVIPVIARVTINTIIRELNMLTCLFPVIFKS